MRYSVIFSVILFFSFSCTNQSPQKAPSGLICELLREPSHATITDNTPEFGWIVNDDRRGAKQTAWQILVASSKAEFDNDIGNMWDSGKIISSQSINIEYQGKPLQPNMEYWWNVRI